MSKIKERLEKQLADTQAKIKELSEREEKIKGELENLNQKEFFNLLQKSKIPLDTATEILREKISEKSEKDIAKTEKLGLAQYLPPTKEFYRIL
jgi:cell division protein FtsB